MDLRGCVKVMFFLDGYDEAPVSELQGIELKAEIAFGSNEVSIAPVIPEISVEAIRVSQHVDTKKVRLSLWIRSTQEPAKILDALKPIFQTVLPTAANVRCVYDNLLRTYSEDES